VYNDEDALASVICKKEREDVTVLEYGTPKHTVRNGQTYMISADGKEIPVRFFGAHNLSNANGARTLLSKLGIHDDQFYEAIQSFEGAARRLERIAEKNGLIIFRDFAHAPSKLEASVNAVKNQYPGKKIHAVLELHTFSSLNKDFIPTYAHTMDAAEDAYLYFNPEVVKHKNLEAISLDDLKKAFERTDLHIFTDSGELFKQLESQSYPNDVLLLMSSGNFNGTDISSFATNILNRI
jgi:UDP-N-acetylmuramate: L-alanyl-gamma-D-glutamyl-meso-diaminopimelate ligase